MSKRIKALMDWWNSIATQTQCRKIRDITQSRLEKSRLRINEGLLDEGEELKSKILASDFLSGRSNKWKCTFDWLIANDKNWVKILEGNYDNEDDGDYIARELSE